MAEHWDAAVAWAFFNMDDMQQRNNVRAQQLATMISEATQQVIGQKIKSGLLLTKPKNVQNFSTKSKSCMIRLKRKVYSSLSLLVLQY